MGHNRAGSGSLSSTSPVTDGNGQATVEFTITMSPGDNFRVAASLDSSKLQDPYLTQAMADGGAPPDGVAFSPMLTVWRHLWIEQDSMKAVATASEEEKNFVSGTAASYQYFLPNSTKVDLGQHVPADFRETNHFLSGFYKVNNLASPFPVLDFHVDLNFGIPPDDEVTVPGDLIYLGAGWTYDLYDDDYEVLPGNIIQLRESLPWYPSLGSYADQFRRAYIEPVYLTGVSDLVSFDRNMSWFEFHYGSWDDQRDIPNDSSGFWVVLVVGAWQYTPSEDLDGDTAPTSGISIGDENRAAIFVEVCRDGGNDKELITAHEIGHTGRMRVCPQINN